MDVGAHPWRASAESADLLWPLAAAPPPLAEAAQAHPPVVAAAAKNCAFLCIIGRFQHPSLKFRGEISYFFPYLVLWYGLVMQIIITIRQNCSSGPSSFYFLQTLL